MNYRFFRFLCLTLAVFCISRSVSAQELNCTFKLVYSQIQGTNTSVFETLETAIREFVNNREWTDLQFGRE